MATNPEDIERALQRAQQAGDTEAVQVLSNQLREAGGYEPTGPALSRVERERKIGALQTEADASLSDVPKWMERDALRETGGGALTPSQRLVRRPTGEYARVERPGAAGSIQDFGAALETGVTTLAKHAFQRPDDRVELKRSLFDQIYSQLPQAEQERLRAPRHMGVKYDSYRNMPAPDFLGAVTESGLVSHDDIRAMVGEQEYERLVAGDLASVGNTLYEHIVQPFFSKGEKTPSQRLAVAVQEARAKYTDETRASVEKPFIAEGAELTSPTTWFDETTKAPWEDWDGFIYSVIEQTPNFAAAIGGARTGGRLGANIGSRIGQRAKAHMVDKLQRKGAQVGGIIGGAGAEGMLIRDAVYSEVSERTKQLPDEKWQQHPEYTAMLEAGFSEEAAKQVIAFDAANKAGNTAMVVSGFLMGSPMAAFFGSRAAGRLGGHSVGRSVATGALGEPLQEGVQETTEQFVSNLGVSAIDPTQPLFQHTGEAFAGGFMIGIGPGALGAFPSGDTAGIDRNLRKVIKATTDYTDAANERWEFQNSLIEDGSDGGGDTPKERLEALQRLERLQRKEAEALLKAEPLMRDYMMKHASPEGEVKMLNRLQARANATLTDIAVAKSRRTTAAQMLEQERLVQREREEIARRVNADMLKLEDVTSLADAIEKVQHHEAITTEQLEELKKEGYGRWSPTNERFVILPKGARALKELRRQQQSLQAKLDSGYTGEERRDPARAERREAVRMASPQEREEMIYTDHLTGLPNKRAFDERETQAPVVVAADVDSLKWVNDNMGHLAGDKLLQTVADALKKQRGVMVYRRSGDEFAITAATEEAAENAMQAAAAELRAKTIRFGQDAVSPAITWGKGSTYAEADAKANEMKQERERAGKRAKAGTKPPSYSVTSQGRLRFHEPPKKTGVELAEHVAKKSGQDPKQVRNKIQKRLKLHEARKDEGEFPLLSEFAWDNAPGDLDDIAAVEDFIGLLRSQLSTLLQMDDDGEAVMDQIGFIYHDLAVLQDIMDDASEFGEQRQAIPTKWRDVRDEVTRGFEVEILTPNGAVQGTVARVRQRRSPSRDRLDVIVEGRKFVFNPTRNWLIRPEEDRDLEWLNSGVAVKHDPKSPPNIVKDIRIGHIGEDGYLIADLGGDYGTSKDKPWQTSMFPDFYSEAYANDRGWDIDVPYLKPLKREATEEQMAQAQAIVGRLTADHHNLPNITLSPSITHLEELNPELVDEMRAQGASEYGTRGFFDEKNPENGIVLLVQNIAAYTNEAQLERDLTETLLHEMIGHYGVRGVFGSDAQLEVFMHEIVDRFPELAKSYQYHATQKGGSKTLQGEEMFAYIAGEILSGNLTLTKPGQKNLWQRLMAWIRNWMHRYFPRRVRPAKLKTRAELKYEFWTDEEIQRLVRRSMDFVRNGPRFEYLYKTGQHVRLMRDGDIFQSGLMQAVNTGTVSLSKAQRKQLKAKYAPNEVPKEIPMFPDEGSPNVYMNAVKEARKAGFISAKEMETSHIEEFLTKATYKEIVMVSSGNNTPGTGDFTAILPPQLAKEYEEVSGITTDFLSGRGSLELTPEESQKMHAAADRVSEIQEMKIDQKHTRLTKDTLLAYLQSEKVVNVVPIPSTGSRPNFEDYQAAVRLGLDVDGEYTDEQRQEIARERSLTRQRGPFIGFNKHLQQWQDYRASASYPGSIPQGLNRNLDYREYFLQQKGGGYRVGRTGHFQGTEGVLVHIRFGLGQLMQSADQFPGVPEARNPEMKDKALVIGEIQTDWLQNLRKSWGSLEEKEAGHRFIRSANEELRAINKQIAERISVSLRRSMDAMLEPLEAFVKGEESPEQRAEFERFKAREGNEGVSDDTMRSMFAGRQLRQIMSRFTHALEKVTEYRTNATGAIHSMDARAFEHLDQKAVTSAAYTLARDLEGFNERLQILAEQFGSPEWNGGMAQIFQRVKDSFVDGDLLYNFRYSLSSGDASSYVMRVPAVIPEFRKMLSPVYQALNMDGLDGDLNAAESRKVYIAHFPEATAAAGLFTSDNVVSAFMRALTRDRIMEAGISPSVAVTVKKDTRRVEGRDEVFIDVSLSGSEDDVKAAHEKLGSILDGPFKDQLSAMLRLMRESEQRQRDTGLPPHLSDLTWPDVESQFDIEEVDTDYRSAQANEWDVETYEQYEESNYGDEFNSHVNDAIENIDWTGVEDGDGNPLTPQNPEYRDRLQVDDDGDVDHSIAEEWLEDQRDEYIRDLRNDDDGFYAERVRENLREAWDDRGGTSLWLGRLDTSWDEDGDPDDDVPIVVRRTDLDEPFELLIDSDEVWSGSEFDEAGIIKAIDEWYRDNDHYPPEAHIFGKPMQPPVSPDQLSLLEQTPDLNAITDAVKASMTTTVTTPEPPLKVFEKMVTLQKKRDSINADSPLSADKYWRTSVLRFLLADAVRRGIPAIVWNPGMASTARGGMPAPAAVDAIRWQAVEMEIRGEAKEFWIINAANIDAPIMVDPARGLPVLSHDVVEYIKAQRRGEKPKVRSINEGGSGELTVDDFLISESTVGGSYFSLYERATHRYIGLYASQEALDRAIQNEITNQNAGRVVDEAAIALPRDGTVIDEGKVTEKDIGGLITIISGGAISGYSHTQNVPRLAGSRMSYEDITVRIFNKELKQYGVQVEEHAIKVENVEKARVQEGARIVRNDEQRNQRIAEVYGNIDIVELQGPMHGWLVASEKKGLLFEAPFTRRADAEADLANKLEYEFGNAAGYAKVFYIPINDKIVEDYDGKPKAPFHFDPRKDPVLREALDKIGQDDQPSFRERWKQWRQAWKDEFHAGMFDRFYGLKRALRMSGQEFTAETDPYIQTRLTTSLDSVMKAAMEYGHPVWKDGIVQTEGKGFADIMRPVINDIDTWCLYMAGKRAKGLMLEGYGKLPADQRKLIDKAASQFKGKTDQDRILALLAHVTKDAEQAGATSRREFLKALGAMAVASQTGLPVSDALDSAAAQIVLPDLDASRQRKVNRTRPHRKQKRKDKVGRLLEPQERFKNPEQARFRWIKELTKQPGVSKEQAEAAIDRVIKRALEDQRAADAARQTASKAEKAAAEKNDDLQAAMPAIKAMMQSSREWLFSPTEIQRMVRLADDTPVLEQVAKEYAAYNKKVLDFAEEAGVINSETRPMWESADYVPFYRVRDDRLVGPFSAGSGIAEQNSPIKRLEGSEANVGDIMHNIMINLTKLIDTSMKNHAALMSVDALLETGIVQKKPMTFSQEMIPLNQVRKLLLDRGLNPDSIPKDALEGFQKMFAIQPPEGPGVISVLRKGKKEFYYTDDELLYRSMTSINQKAWGAWMNLLRGPKRLLTAWVTLAPEFMIANYMRDALSAFVLSRDHFMPVTTGLKGFAKALTKDDDMKIMLSAGAAFESGYINQYDPKATRRTLKKAMKSKSFRNTLLTSPVKLYEAWKAIGSATENANRMAVYEAALRAGKSKAQAVFEAKDLMDFSMRGDWPVIQFLVQTVPFMGARLQGLHRLGRGAHENPVAFTVKGTLVGLAGLALWFMYRDDERYKELEDWDKDTYFHFWIGDNHFRLPKPFEVGAIFNTIPERIFEYMYSNENDAGKHLFKRFGFMLAETFNANPVPQAFKPMLESYFNYNWFTGRDVVSPYEEKRLPPEQYRYYTSPTMVEIARALPSELDAVSGKIRSPLHLQNLYRGYTSTIGGYFLQASDALLRQMMDYPEKPARTVGEYPVVGRFARGDVPRRTNYEQEVYDLLRKTTAIQGSVNFLAKTDQLDRLEEISQGEYEPYIQIAGALEDIREEVSSINEDMMHIYLDKQMTPEQKREELDALQEQKNQLFKQGYEMRPGSSQHPGGPITQSDIDDLIDRFGVDDQATAQMKDARPETANLLESIEQMNRRSLESLAKVSP